MSGKLTGGRLLMNKDKIDTVKGMCVVALTRFIMDKYGLKQDKAYRKLLMLELYGLLNDTETRLYLETNEFLCEACETELEKGKDALYNFINTV
jgi:hypothetical protein